MNGLLDGMIPFKTDHPMVGRCPVSVDEPLDLTKPLDLSRKPQTITHGHVSAERVRNDNLASLQQVNRTNVASKTPSKFPLLGATRYPLQRGLAYVQPHKIRQSQNGAERGFNIQSANHTQCQTDKAQTKRNQDAMQQRLRSEAANIAALQAQASQAAHAAASKAMARHALEVQTSAVQVKQRAPETQMTSSSLKPVEQSTNGSARVHDHRKRSHSGHLTSTYPIQRPMSNATLQALMLQRQWLQKSNKKDIQSEQDLLRAYRAMIATSSVSPHTLSQPRLSQTQMNSAATSHAPRDTQPDTLKHGYSGHVADTANGINHAHIKQAQQKPDDRQMAGYEKAKFPTLAKGQEKAVVKIAIKDREREILRQQHEYILRQKQQLMEDLNKNRKLYEYAKREKERNAMIQDLKNAQYTRLLKAQERQKATENHAGRRAPTIPHNQEYLAALTAYKAARADLANSSPPVPVLVPQKLYSPEFQMYPFPRPDSGNAGHVPPPKGSKLDSQPKAVHIPKFPSPNVYADEAKKRMPAEQPTLNAVHAKSPELESASYHSRKKLSSVPVRDRLLLARMTERERREFMIFSGYAQPPNRQNSHLHFQDPKNRSPTSFQLSEKGDIIASNAAQQPTRVDTRIIDLTGGSFPQSPVTGPPSGLTTEQPIRNRNSRLPSYDDAIAAQNTLVPGKSQDGMTPDIISSLARRLVSSSQEWLKKYLTPEREAHSQQGVDILRHNSDERTQPMKQTIASSCGAEASLNNITINSSPAEQAKSETTTAAGTLSNHQDLKNCKPLGNSSQVLRIPDVVSYTDGKEGQREDISHATNAPQRPGRALSYDPRKKHIANSGSNGSSADSANDSKTPSERPIEKCRSEYPLLNEPLQGEKAAGSAGVPSEGSKRATTENDLMQADSATLGREERALQRAILRFNDPEKQLPVDGVQELETKEVDLVDIGTGLQRRKRRRRKPSKFRPRNRAQRSLSSTISTVVSRTGRKRGRPRRTSLPPTLDLLALSRVRFQDFVPTIMGTRTRHDGTGQMRNYRSMYDTRNARYELEIEKERFKVLERRRRLHECNSVGNTSATETDNDTVQDEECAPPIKRPRGRPRSKPVVPNGGKSNKILKSTAEDAPSSLPIPSGESPVSPSQPLRVVLEENSPNHIKIKFVNVRSAQKTDTEEETPPPPRRRGRPPKSAARKHKTKTKNIEPPNSPEPPTLEIMSPRDEDKENDSDYEDFVQDPDFDVIDTELTSPEFAHVPIIRPEPPQEFKKIIVNKKLGETVLHRAATFGSMEIASYCVDYRVIDINARDNAGYTALHESCVHGHLDIARYFLSHGADVNAGAADGTRPIHDAVDNDRVELVRLLLAYGADPFLTTYTGRRITKLALARSSEMKTLLFGYLRDVNGDRSKLEDAPQSPMDYQWSFNGSCSLFDSNSGSDTDIFADVPGPDVSPSESECEPMDEGIFFEMSEQTVLPSFNIRLENQDKFRNWLLLADVTERLSLTRDQLIAAHPNIKPVTLLTEQFNQYVQESQVTRASFADGASPNHVLDDKEEEVTLIELNDGLRKIIGVEVQYV